MYRLIFQTGRYAGRSLAVRQSLLVVGRDPDCHLTLSGEAALTKHHFRLEENAVGVFVCTLSSIAVLKVNGVPVEGDRLLREGDILEVGGTRIRFSVGAGEIGEREEKRRLARKGKVDHGTVQPLSVLLSVGLVVAEVALIWFLVAWAQVLVSPESEQADAVAAEAIRLEKAGVDATAAALVAASTNAADAVAAPAAPIAPTPKEKQAIVSMPGELSAEVVARREEVAAAAEKLAADPKADLAAETNATVVAMAVLHDANFEPATSETALENLPQVSSADPRIAEAQRLLAQADAAAQFADYAEALRLLGEIHKSAPGFLPAYEQHARILERQGKLSDALVRWRQLKGLSPVDSPFHARAEEEIVRVEAALALARANGGETVAAAAADSQVRIRMPEVQKLPNSENGDLAEMRVLRTALEIPAGVFPRGGVSLQVYIEFFDRTAEGEIVASQALVPDLPVMVRVPAGADARTLELADYTYVIPRGLIGRNRAATTEYYGYRIRVFSGTQLLAAVAKPKKLMDMPATGIADAAP